MQQMHKFCFNLERYRNRVYMILGVVSNYFGQLLKEIHFDSEENLYYLCSTSENVNICHSPFSKTARLIL